MISTGRKDRKQPKDDEVDVTEKTEKRRVEDAHSEQADPAADTTISKAAPKPKNKERRPKSGRSL